MNTGMQGEGLGLVTTRSYKYDKLLEQYGRNNFGPNVDNIKKELEKGDKIYVFKAASISRKGLFSLVSAFIQCCISVAIIN